MTQDKRFAKDVAKHLDRRRMRRKFAFWTSALGLAVLAVMYVTCGRGFGIGGKGEGSGSGRGSGSGSVVAIADAGPQRCQIRVTADGIAVDGMKMTRDEAVAACKVTTGADVVVTGDARQGDWDALKAALDAAGVALFTKDIAVRDAGA